MSEPIITATLASFLKMRRARFSEESAEIRLREIFGIQVHTEDESAPTLTVPTTLTDNVGFLQFLKTLVAPTVIRKCSYAVIDDDFCLQKILQIERECGVLFKFNRQTRNLEVIGCDEAMRDFLKNKNKYLRYSITYKSESEHDWKEINGELHKGLQDSIFLQDSMKLKLSRYGDIWVDLTNMCISDNSTFKREIRIQMRPNITMFDQYPGLKNYRKFRSVVLDGSNVASYHGNSKVFSVEGLLIAINFFRFAGVRVKATIPIVRMNGHYHRLPLIDPNGILPYLEKNDLIIRADGYEDHLVVDYARSQDAVIVSNDTFHDLKEPELASHISSFRFPFSCRGNVFSIGRERRTPTFEEVIVLP